MNDEKDRYGDKLHEIERAREGQWARQRDQLLLEKMRARQRPLLHCPLCDLELSATTHSDLSIMACPNGHGAWLEEAELAKLRQARR